MLRNTIFVALVALVLAGCETPLGGIFGGTVTPIKVTSPNGGEIWLQGDTQTIAWEAIGLTADNVTIDYSIDDGVSWTNIDTALASANSYDWTVPNDDSKLCRVRVLEARSGGRWDESDADFRITPPVVEVTTPNGGEFWLVGDTETITWIAVGATATDVDIEYDAQLGAGWQAIATVPIAPGSYDWVVPDDESITCLVRVQEAGGGGLTDDSDADFAITVPFIEVTSPNGAEEWGIGMPYDITWDSAGVMSVEIHYSIDSGTTYDPADLIATVSAADGSYTWTVPNDPIALCRVRVKEVGGSIDDQSDNDFTIKVPIEVTSPNLGTEVWDLGTTENITWDSVGLTNVRIELFRNGAWEELEPSAPDTGTYAWDLIDAPAADALIRVSDAATGAFSDESGDVFTIAGVMVITPNGGETLTVDTIYDVTWMAEGVADVNVRYSINDGADWTTIDNVPGSDLLYSWTVPNDPSVICLVRVREPGPLGLGDDSDVVFTIAP